MIFFSFFQIPRSEIYEPAISNLESCDLTSLSSPATNFRVRASTISNGHVSRLKTLLETQVKSSRCRLRFPTCFIAHISINKMNHQFHKKYWKLESFVMKEGLTRFNLLLANFIKFQIQGRVFMNLL